MKEYPKIIDGKGIEIDIQNKEFLSFACCDCGLIHTIAFAIEENGKLGMAVKRDINATNKRRKQKSVQKSIRQIAQENT